MREWQSGRESGLLDDIISGAKTVEGRLRRGKFTQYRIGDRVHLRRDVRDSHGLLHDGASPEVTVRIIAIRTYHTFLEMTESEEYSRVIPRANSAYEAASQYDSYYSAQDQARYGVLAIEIAYVPQSALSE